MVGPSTLSTAMGCPRRFRTLIEHLHQHHGPPGQDRRGGNDDHQREGMLLESILQFIAVGRDIPDERNFSAMEDRYDLVLETLEALERPGERFLQEHADALLVKQSNARALIGHSVADLVSKMIESMTQFFEYIEDNGLENCRWESEVEVEGVIATPFGEVDARGRIDLLCHIEDTLLVIEIKKRDRYEESDTIQAQFYALLLGVGDCQISVINAGVCEDPKPAQPVQFPFGPEDRDVTVPNSKNCNHCPDSTCTDSFVGN